MGVRLFITEASKTGPDWRKLLTISNTSDLNIFKGMTLSVKVA